MDRMLRKLRSGVSSLSSSTTCIPNPSRTSGDIITITPRSARSSTSHDSVIAASTIRCSICQEDLDESDSATATQETACILPCSHIFGSTCIQKWLSTSPHHNCPTCRHSMLYSSCQHPIEPLSLSDYALMTHPECFPSKCQLCRHEGKWSREVELLEEALWFEQGILERLGTFLAWDFGTLSSGYVVNIDVDDRAVESRRRFETGWKDIRSRYEAEAGRSW